jgi:hypothetical protein
MGFIKAQREQIHVPGATDGAFIPAAAKSNGLIAGTTGGEGAGEGTATTGGGPLAGVSQV